MRIEKPFDYFFRRFDVVSLVVLNEHDKHDQFPRRASPGECLRTCVRGTWNRTYLRETSSNIQRSFCPNFSFIEFSMNFKSFVSDLFAFDTCTMDLRTRGPKGASWSKVACCQRSCRDPRGTNVSWSKRYERIMIHRMWTVRDRKGTNGLGLKGYERNGTEKGTSGSMVTRTPNALCWAWTHMMAIGCPTGQYMSVSK